jgi:hypothetical protein
VNTAVSAAMLILMAHTVSGQYNRPLREGSLLDLFGLTGGTKAFGQFEKGLLFLPASFDSVLDSRGIACIVCSLGSFALSRWTKSRPA